MASTLGQSITVSLVVLIWRIVRDVRPLQFVINVKLHLPSKPIIQDVIVWLENI